MDKNPYWYKFSCFTSGTLSFLITPNNLNDDYDWQLFDVTGHDAAEVYTNAKLFVACNWSGRFGKTGASAAGSSLVNCEGNSYPLFSAMPTLQQGHNYLLLISHFTNSQSGYSLAFGGGTAGITDTTPPNLQGAHALCDAKRISIKLNKKMKCSTLAANGSDFILSATSSSIVSASGINCSNGFDMDSLILFLDNPLIPGNYTVSIKNGTDANTLLDNCDAAIPAGTSVSFTVFPRAPTPFDSIMPPGCAPDELQLIFRDPVLCSSIAADGSDFALSSPSSAVITGAGAPCTGGLTNVIKLQLSAPIYNQGINVVTLQTGSDGNTIINECSIETPEGAAKSFSTKDTVSADFNFKINYGCKADTGVFSHNGNNEVNEWHWQFDSTATSLLQNNVYVYPGYGQQHVSLFASNGICTDTSSVDFILDNELKANFTAPSFLCPQDVATFKDTSIGKIVSWNWDFGNGNISTVKNPAVQVYPPVSADKNIPVRLIIQNDFNCFDTAFKPLKVLYNCYIAVASAFTPNGDGRNDYLYPLNAWKAKNLVFRVYSRYGQLIYLTTDFMQKWDGTFKGIQQQTGTYVWTLQYINTDTNQPYFLKGTTVLIR